jgi:plastocyanin
MSFSACTRKASTTSWGQQHHVAVRLEGRELVANPHAASSNAGDLVTWNTPDNSIAGYMITGEGTFLSFSRASLLRKAVYPHAFGVPGTYSNFVPDGAAKRG